MFLFNTFQRKLKSVYAFGLSVCLSVRLSVCALALVNILRMTWNLYMLRLFSIQCFLLKMVYIGQTVHVQGHTKVFSYIIIYGLVRCSSNKYSSNDLKYTFCTWIHNNMFPIENGIHWINGSYTGTHKILRYIAYFFIYTIQILK